MIELISPRTASQFTVAKKRCERSAHEPSLFARGFPRRRDGERWFLAAHPNYDTVKVSVSERERERDREREGESCREIEKCGRTHLQQCADERSGRRGKPRVKLRLKISRHNVLERGKMRPSCKRMTTTCHLRDENAQAPPIHTRVMPSL